MISVYVWIRIIFIKYAWSNIRVALSLFNKGRKKRNASWCECISLLVWVQCYSCIGFYDGPKYYWEQISSLPVVCKECAEIFLSWFLFTNRSKKPYVQCMYEHEKKLRRRWHIARHRWQRSVKTGENIWNALVCHINWSRVLNLQL